MSDVFQKQIFSQCIGPLLEAFPPLKTKTKLDRIFWFVRDLPERAMKEIFDTLIDASRVTPTPIEIDTLARAWRKRHNFYPSIHAGEQVEIKTCQYCRDSGVVRIQHLSNQEVDHLMRCNCFESWRSEHMKFPQFEYQLKQVYKVTPCPIEWFKPSDKNPNGKEFFELLDVYKLKIKNAEKYWADLGFKAN